MSNKIAGPGLGVAGFCVPEFFSIVDNTAPLEHVILD